MREACIRAVTRALGYEPTQAQLRNIEARMQNARVQAARKDPDSYRALSEEEQLMEAGKLAAQELVQEKQTELQRAERVIVVNDQLGNYRASQIAGSDIGAHDPDGVAAMFRTMVAHYDLEKNGGMVSVETDAHVAFDAAMANIEDVFNKASPGLWRRIQEGIGPGQMEPLWREFTLALRDPNAKVQPVLRDAANRYNEASVAFLEEFNGLGGVVGRLEDFGTPQSWSARLLSRHGREAYIEDMLTKGWLNRSRYVHENGQRYSEVDLRELLSEAWNTGTSDGWSKTQDTANFPGGAVKANRHSHHRIIHLKPEFAYDALAKYSDQTVLESMVGNLRRMARDVALVRKFGPNPDYMVQKQLDEAVHEASRILAEASPSGNSAKARAGRERIRKAQEHLVARAEHVRNVYDHLAGNDPLPMRRAVADAFATARNLNVASKLGSATLSSIGDYPTLYHTAILNRLNPLKVMLNSNLIHGGKSRRYIRRMGLALDTILQEMDRWSGDNMTSRDLSSKTASAVIRTSFLPLVTRARRVGFAMTMMDTIGHLTQRYVDVTKLKENDWRILASKGINQATWDIWRAARKETWGLNHTLLTPDAIMAVESVRLNDNTSRIIDVDARRQAVRDLLSIVRDEQDLAIVTPGAREHQAIRRFIGRPRTGTPGGELWLSAAQFKSFPWAFVTRHAERASAYSAYGRFSYLAIMFLFMTMAGAARNWIDDLLNGKDPRNMNPFTDNPDARADALANMGAAALRGGGVGVYGDFLFSETNPYTGGSFAETAMGPTSSTIAQGLRLTTGNLFPALQGEETNFGSESVQFARSNTPFANLWYTKALTDRAIFNELREMADPGSVDRMMDRQNNNQGTTYWWAPTANPMPEILGGNGEGPERAPDLEAGTRAN